MLSDKTKDIIRNTQLLNYRLMETHDKGLNKKRLTQMVTTSTSTMAKLAKYENVTAVLRCKICKALACDFGDITEYEKESEN